jgi:hypothetical protein
MSFTKSLVAVFLALAMVACTTTSEEAVEADRANASDKADDEAGKDGANENVESVSSTLTASGGGCPCRLPACWPYCRVAETVVVTTY